MILETILDGKSQSVQFALSELLEPEAKKKRDDDIRVRAYVVRSHWRKRWHPKAKARHLTVVKKRA